MDITNTVILGIDSLKIGEKYTKKGAFDSDCTFWVDKEGDLFSTHVVNSDKIEISYKNVNIGGVLNCVASEDGKSFEVNGKIFKIEE